MSPKAHQIRTRRQSQRESKTEAPTSPVLGNPTPSCNSDLCRNPTQKMFSPTMRKLITDAWWVLPQPPRPIWEVVSLTAALLVHANKRAPVWYDLKNTMTPQPIFLQNIAMKS